MRVLAIECATEACSAALFDEDALLGGFCEVLGRGHAERLVPMIADLPDKGRADRILVSLGPGSFTGVRIGIAAARALGLAWQAQVLGYPTLALVAAQARALHPASSVTVCMNGGHGECFVQDFDDQGLPAGMLASIPMAKLGDHPDQPVIAGNKAQDKAATSATNACAEHMLPDARTILALPTTLLTSNLAPIYGRAPDAKPAASRPAQSRPAGA